MKKLLLIITVLLLFSGTAYAYESVNAGYIIMKTGLSGLPVEPQTDDGWKTFYISIKGEDLGYLLTNNAEVKVPSDFEIRLIPKGDYLADKNGYRLWQINGRYNDEFFFIGGISIEGDILHNSLVPHSFALFFFLLAVAMALMVWQINRGSRMI